MCGVRRLSSQLRLARIALVSLQGIPHLGFQKSHHAVRRSLMTSPPATGCQERAQATDQGIGDLPPIGWGDGSVTLLETRIYAYF